MTVDNKLISQKLVRIATLLKFDDPDGFRANAFRNASKTVQNLKQPIETMDYLKLSGIGKSTGACIAEMITSDGKFCTRLSELEEKYPPDLMTLTEIDKVSPKRAEAIAKKYGIRTLMEMYTLVKEGKKKVPAKLAADVLFAVEEKQRQPYHAVIPFLDALQVAVVAHDNVLAATWVGSMRRGRPAIKNADLLLTINADRSVVEDYIRELVQKEYRATILDVGLSGKAWEHLTASWPVGDYGFLPVEFIMTTPDVAGVAQFFYTGSKAHNTAVSRLAREKGLLIDEKGIRDSKSGAIIGGKSESEVYNNLGIHYWPPEFRDEADLTKIPPIDTNNGVTLFNATQSRHCHTDWSDDGEQTMKEAVEAARNCGITELTFTDHSSAVRFTAVGSEATYITQVRTVASWFPDMKISAGVEVDIELDGTLGWSQPRLMKMDFVVASIHDKIHTDVEKRLISAINNPVVKMIGHCTGRIIGQTALPMDVDWEKVFTAAAMRGVIIEINCRPLRIDPPRELIILAKRCGCKFSISDDAHGIDGFGVRATGVQVARNAWLTVHDLAK